MNNSLILESEQMSVEIDRDSGAVLALIDRAADVNLISDQRLAENFRLLLPLPDLRSNYLYGMKQTLTGAKDTGNGIELRWDGPLKNDNGAFDMDVVMQIELVGEQLQWRCRVENRTEHELTEVWYAIVGGMTGLAEGEGGRDTEALLPIVNKKWMQPIFRDFGNTRGQTLGIHTGEHNFSYPGTLAMPWLSLYDAKRNRGLYFAALEESPRVKSLRLTLEPGMAEGRSDGNWPRRDEVGELPYGLIMHWVHVPYTKPGEMFESATAVLQLYEGDWRGSADIYRDWFASHYPLVEPGSQWIRRQTAFMHTMMMLPEDNLNFRYTDLPQMAREAVARNVTHINITGWDVGGHDRGYPQYDPDPRLGTWEELESGIRACHELGMKVSFFVNCQPIDMTTEWYERELHKYRIVNPHGIQYHVTSYWGMGTLSARSLFMTGTPFSEMNPAHPEVRQLLISRFLKLVEIGADGLHIDKFFQTPMDFNPRLKGTSPDCVHHEGILLFVEELLAACRAVNPEFCFSYEGGWDRLFSYSDTIWWGNGEDSVMKAVFPQLGMVCGIEQPYDFNKLNLAILEGQILLIGPANYNAAMDYPPMQELSMYIAELTRLRNELFDLVSNAEKLDASHDLFKRLQPLLTGSGEFADNPDVRWSVYRHLSTGQRGVILANLSGAPVELEDIALDGAQGTCRIIQPFEAERSSQWPVAVRIPAERVAFLVEAAK